MAAVKILRLKGVRAKTGLSRTSIYRLISSNLFPRPIKLGARASGWVESEVESFLKARIAQRKAA